MTLGKVVFFVVTSGGAMSNLNVNALTPIIGHGSSNSPCRGFTSFPTSGSCPSCSRPSAFEAVPPLAYLHSIYSSHGSRFAAIHGTRQCESKNPGICATIIRGRGVWTSQLGQRIPSPQVQPFLLPCYLAMLLNALVPFVALSAPHPARRKNAAQGLAVRKGLLAGAATVVGALAVGAAMIL